MPDRPLRVLHTIPTLDVTKGMGPAQSLAQLAREQVRQGLSVSIITVDGPATSASSIEPLRAAGVDVHCTGPGRGPFSKGAETRAALRRLLQEGKDVVHIHSLWLYMTNCAAPEARRARVPYLIQT